MKRMTKGLIVTGIFVIALTGCTSHQQAKMEAHERWQQARARVLLSLGDEQFTIGDLSNARNCATEAMSLAPELPESHILIARIALEKGDYAKADRRLKTAGLLVPDNAQVTYLSGVVRERQGRLTEALERYEKARALDPNNPAPVLASAEVLVALDRSAEALELIESKATSMDESLCMYKAAGELAMLVGQPQRAVEHFVQARYIDPEDPALREQLAKAHFFAGQYGKSINLLKALRLQSDYADCAWLHSMLGNAYLATAAPQDARACFDRAIDLEPDSPRHWIDQAKAALHCNDVTRAALSATQALHLAPGAPEATLILGYALLAKGKSAEANDLLAQAVQKHPSQATLQCLLGRSYSALGHTDKATACYQATLKIEPDNLLALHLLASAKE